MQIDANLVKGFELGASFGFICGALFAGLIFYVVWKDMKKGKGGW